MPALGLLFGTEKDNYGDTPTLPLVNIFVTGSKTEPGQYKLIGREPLRYVSTTEINANGSTAAYREDGVLSGSRVLIFGTDAEFPSGMTTMSGSLVPSIAGNQIGAIATLGEGVKFDDGATVRDVTFPDGANVSKVLESQGRFIFIRADSHRYYWTLPLANMLDGSGDITIDGLDFASAESEPDQLRDGLIFRTMLVLFGAETIEFHAPTGNDNQPWAPIVGNTIDKGILQTGCATAWGNSFAWIGQDYSIYSYTGSGTQKISNEGIERTLRSVGNGSGYPRLDSFNYEGHEFLRLWLDSDTPDLLLDAQSGEWCEWSSSDGAFRGGPVLEIDDYLVFYDKNIGKQLYLSSVRDFAQGALEASVKYQFRAGVPADGGAVPVHNVMLRCQSDLAGATIEMRTSRNGGTVWGAWQGLILDDRRNKVEWRSQGVFNYPGFLADFRVTASGYRLSGAYFNEYGGGRAYG